MLIVFLTCYVVFYFVVVACRLWMRLRRYGTRRWMRQPFTIIAALLAPLILPLTAIQWTNWPFVWSFRREHTQFVPPEPNGLPYVGPIRVGNVIYMSRFTTDAGPLFPTVSTRDREAGYLYRPEGAPSREKWWPVVTDENDSYRSRIRFHQVYPLSSGWYGVVWEWQKTRAPIDGS